MAVVNSQEPEPPEVPSEGERSQETPPEARTIRVPVQWDDWTGEPVEWVTAESVEAASHWSGGWRRDP
ncbi:hypothetical protein GCM10027562_17690 [Arthrobacter pigmenti]